MRKPIIFALIFIVLPFSVLLSGRLNQQFNEVITANVEALTFDEWGGGNDIGGGVISWYDHQRIDIDFHYYLHLVVLEKDPLTKSSLQLFDKESGNKLADFFLREGTLVK